MIHALSRALLGCIIVALVCALMCVAIIAMPMLRLGTLLVEVIELMLDKVSKQRGPRSGNVPPARFPQEPPFRNPRGPSQD